jgi:serpin B
MGPRAGRRATPPRIFVALAAAAILASSCDTGPGPTPASSSVAPGSPAPSTAGTDATPSVPTASAAAARPLDALVDGALAEVVTDNLRVRSDPGTGDESVIHAPKLQRGARLAVLAGPVEASGYRWYQVAPLDVQLEDGVTDGWVAVADRDGTPWVGLADDPTPGFELVGDTASRVDPSAAAAIGGARSVNGFGLALYRALGQDPEHAGRGLVVSPYSIATALAMARAGARGDTATEMDKVLRADGWDALGAGLGALDQRLQSQDGAWVEEAPLGDGSNDKDTHYLALRTANMAFAQQGFAIDDEYVEQIGRTLGSGLGLVDYQHAPDNARDAINGWVERQTAGRIKNLLMEGDVTTDTRVVLANAIYLKGEWAVPFVEDDTRDRDFESAAGPVRVPTMETSGGQELLLATGDGWRATQLPYLGPQFSRPVAMTIVMPEDLSAFEAHLTPSVLRRVDGALEREQDRFAEAEASDGDGCVTYPYELHLLMPKFGIDTRADLGRTLATLGMSKAMDPTQADLSGITAEEKLSIGSVIHQATIDVDERGTEAAAATAVAGDTGGPGCEGPDARETRTLRLDHPFMYFIRDVDTGAILFMGRVTDPSE